MREDAVRATAGIIEDGGGTAGLTLRAVAQAVRDAVPASDPVGRLRAAGTAFPWPDEPDLLDALVRGLARISGPEPGR